MSGRTQTTPTPLAMSSRRRPPAPAVTLTVSRDGREQEMRAKLGELTPDKTEPAPRQSGAAGGAGRGKLGITAEPLTPDIAAQVGVPRGTGGGVVAEGDPSGPAGKAGIQAGDVIPEIHRPPVS